MSRARELDFNTILILRIMVSGSVTHLHLQLTRYNVLPLPPRHERNNILDDSNLDPFRIRIGSQTIPSMKRTMALYTILKVIGTGETLCENGRIGTVFSR